MTNFERRERYREDAKYRARKRAQVKAYAVRHRERLRAGRHTPEFRAKHARYERTRKLAERIFADWTFRTWQESRQAA